MSPTIAEISPKSAAESPQAVPEAIPSLDQRYQVVCRVLQIETSSSEDRFLTLLRQLKSKLLNGQQVLYVMHQLFLARIPTQEELENLTLYLDHHSESEVIAQLHNCEEFRFGPQSYTRFEAVPQDQLLVDVSHTLRFSHNSGIQRVVRSLSTRLQSQQLPHQFIELDQTLGVYRLVDSETAELLSNWEQVDPATGKVPLTKRVAKRIRKLAGRRLTEKWNRHTRLLRARLGRFATSTPATTSDTVVFIWNNQLLLPELVAEARMLKRVIPLLQHSQVESTLIVYDLLPIKYPEYFVSNEGYIRYLALLRHVDRVSCISKSVEQDLRAFCQLSDRINPTPPLIETHYLGGDFGQAVCSAHSQPTYPISASPDSTSKTETEIPLLLCVGSIEVRKNHRRILRAMIESQKSGCRFKGVFAGNPGWLNEAFLNELDYFRSLGFDVELRRSVSEAELTALYANASLTIYCSLAEGFGLPIVESVIRGVPCITSSIGSMQEIAEQLGGCALADPLSESSMANTITKLLTHQDALENLRQQALQAEWIGWDSYARTIHEFASTRRSACKPLERQVA